MEEEFIFSGYCRTQDQSRMVTVLVTDKKLEEADCCYGNCPYEPNCTIAQSIQEVTK